ncbi:MAG: FAD:protein FMN transferase [Acidimicrobiales bacterium]
MTLLDDAVVHGEAVMGTMVSFHLYPGSGGDFEARAALRAACERLHRLDEIFTTWSPASAMSRFRGGRLRPHEVPAELPVVLELCRQVRAASGGWFDPWAMPGGLDPTGLVKGWAVEQALGLLGGAGLEGAMVNAGGDVALLGHPPGGAGWRIGIRHPWRADALACVIEAEGAVATSGCYERGAHLVDPRNGRPSQAAASATVIGPRLAFADALATALAVGGDEALELIGGLAGYEAYLIRADGTELATAGVVFS